MRETADVLTRIREGALAALARHGLRKLSMTDVGVETGVSRGTLYRYFSTKAQLLDSLGDYVVDTFASTVGDRVAERPDLDDRVRVVRAAVVEFGRRPPYARLLDVEPNLVREFLTERFDWLVEPVAKALAPAAASDRRGLPRMDPGSVAGILLRLAFSYAQVTQQDGSGSLDALDEVVDRLLGRAPHSGAAGAGTDGELTGRDGAR